MRTKIHILSNGIEIYDSREIQCGVRIFQNNKYMLLSYAPKFQFYIKVSSRDLDSNNIDLFAKELTEMTQILKEANELL